MEMFQLAGLLPGKDSKLAKQRAEYYARSLTDEEAAVIELWRTLPEGMPRHLMMRMLKNWVEDNMKQR